MHEQKDFVLFYVLPYFAGLIATVFFFLIRSELNDPSRNQPKCAILKWLFRISLCVFGALIAIRIPRYVAWFGWLSVRTAYRHLFFAQMGSMIIALCCPLIMAFMPSKIYEMDRSRTIALVLISMTCGAMATNVGLGLYGSSLDVPIALFMEMVSLSLFSLLISCSRAFHKASLPMDLWFRRGLLVIFSASFFGFCTICYVASGIYGPR